MAGILSATTCNLQTMEHRGRPIHEIGQNPPVSHDPDMCHLHIWGRFVVRSYDHAIVDLEHSIELLFPVVLALNLSSARSPKTELRVIIPGEPHHSLHQISGELFWRLRLDKNAARLVEVVGRSSPSGGDHGQPERHSLEDYSAAAFAEARQDKRLAWRGPRRQADRAAP